MHSTKLFVVNSWKCGKSKSVWHAMSNCPLFATAGGVYGDFNEGQSVGDEEIELRDAFVGYPDVEGG